MSWRVTRQACAIAASKRSAICRSIQGHHRASSPSEAKRLSLSVLQTNSRPFEDGSQPRPASPEYSCVQNRTRSERKRASPERFPGYFSLNPRLLHSPRRLDVPSVTWRLAKQHRGRPSPSPRESLHPAALAHPGTGMREAANPVPDCQPEPRAGSMCQPYERVGSRRGS